jgi:hypothetical protein
MHPRKVPCSWKELILAKQERPPLLHYSAGIILKSILRARDTRISECNMVVFDADVLKRSHVRQDAPRCASFGHYGYLFGES